MQIGNRVTLRNPIGLYMKVNSIKLDVFTLPDNTPFQHVQDCFEVIRPTSQDVTDMIVRARFRVPQGITFNGAQLRVGDLKVSGEKIVAGGQVADVITITLFAQAIPGAPDQQRQPCVYRPCPDRDRPDYIHPIPFNSTCPQDGISPLALNLELARAAMMASVTAGPEVEGPQRAEPRPNTRHAFSRTGGIGQ